MTRTRTQTALTKLVKLVANIHGELEFVQQLQDESTGHFEAFAIRLRQLAANRDSLYGTLKQFDPELDPADIGTADDWLLAYGRHRTKRAKQQYLSTIAGLVNT